MISMLLYDRDKAEHSFLERQTRDAVAYVTDDSIQIDHCMTSKELGAFLKKNGLSDIGMLDVTGNHGIENATAVRSNYPDMGIMLIADSSMSPLDYIKPGIRAESLLLRPFREADAKPIILEFLNEWHKAQEKSDDHVFILKEKDGITRLPYQQICYIEARMKKIFIRTEVEEYGYYDTLDHLLESLPEEFVRCHRGFIVNKNHIKRLDTTENLVFLKNDMSIPVSRSLKSALKEVL